MALLDRARDLARVGPLAPLPPASVDEEPEEELEMTLVEHLDELRGRIIKSVLALVITTAVAFAFTPRLFQLLLAPAPAGLKLHTFEVAEAFLTYFQVSLMAGFGLATPVIFYQVVAFVMPGLTRRERRLLTLFLPAVVVFFVIGLLFGYFVTLPFAITYLFDFTINGLLEPTIGVQNYIGFVTTILLWMGIAFQTPIVIFFLAKIGVVNAARLSSFRKYAILAAFVIAAVITPTPDPLNQALVAIPLWILYEIGIVLARLA